MAAPSLTIINATNNVFVFFQKPFLKNLPLFVVLFLIQLIQLYANWSLTHSGGLGLFIGTLSWAYALTLPCGLCDNKIWRRFYITSVLFLNIIMGLIALVVAVKLHELIYSIHWLLIFSTNQGEADEFIDSYIDANMIFIITGVTVCSILLYQLMRYLRGGKIVKKKRQCLCP